MSKISQAKEKLQVQEFWTAKQKQSHSLHYAVSYRASFKPELPSFFMQQYLDGKNKTVFDPFGGRGTTALEANILGHKAIHNDINPLSLFIAKANQYIPTIKEMELELSKIDLTDKVQINDWDEKNLSPFYHKDTLKEILNLKKIIKKENNPVLNYIGLTALSRLHGHSDGFFSVYTFPQISITPESQNRNNLKRNQKPEYKEIKSRILSKARRSLKDSLPPFFHEFSKKNLFTNEDSRNLKSITSASCDLLITSPPFLDKVDYLKDNWLRMWFLGINEKQDITILPSVSDWSNFIHLSLKEFYRILKKGSYAVIEVGEVTQGKKIIPLDEFVVKASNNTGLRYETTFINTQKFTKLSNCWGADNNEKGTNSNRCVVFKK